MRLKTVKGPDIATALRRAREECGPDALVLATNEIRGRLGLTSVEITVAVDAETPASAAGPAPPAPPRVAPQRTPPPRGTDARDFSPPIRAAVEALVRSGLSRDLATRFGRIASHELPPHPAAEQLATATAAGIEALVPFGSALPRGRALFVVGPSGAGKTTTVAKLAARSAMSACRPVVIAAADLDRIGALEQTEIFCRHLGAYFAPIAEARDLLDAIEAAGETGIVLVDTPGVGPTDEARLRFVLELRETLPDADVAIVLPCGLHRESAREALDLFAPLRPTCVGFSKVDAGTRIGELVTALAPSKLPLSFVTTGHRVPQDMESASPRELAARLLRSAHRAEARR